jgi:hypothetical protein
LSISVFYKSTIAKVMCPFVGFNSPLFIPDEHHDSRDVKVIETSDLVAELCYLKQLIREEGCTTTEAFFTHMASKRESIFKAQEDALALAEQISPEELQLLIQVDTAKFAFLQACYPKGIPEGIPADYHPEDVYFPRSPVFPGLSEIRRLHRIWRDLHHEYEEYLNIKSAFQCYQPDYTAILAEHDRRVRAGMVYPQ